MFFSPYMERLKLRFAETDKPECVLVTRDTRSLFYRLAHRQIVV